MTEMTPEKATALRKPFPAESIGKLPKGGVMLDYVGHAAVTDRLLTVDPHWSWEPFALDANGLPALDGSRNLWIRLTICGVTRIGVGDGKNAKEIIGDAIRNAAMRFGVALDLWAKEDLVEFAHAAQSHQHQPTPPAPPAPPAAPAPTGDKPMTAKTRGRMFALFAERGITDEQQQRDGMAAVLNHPVESRADLTEADARQIIASLEGHAA